MREWFKTKRPPPASELERDVRLIADCVRWGLTILVVCLVFGAVAAACGAILVEYVAG